MNVSLPAFGGGYLTSTCLVDGQVYGEKRDCEFSIISNFQTCTPGAQVELTCSAPGNNYEVLRVCESSIALGNVGTACRYSDFVVNGNNALANVIVAPHQFTIVNFQCPTARDSVEVGGGYSLYGGAFLNGIDTYTPIVCTVVPPTTTKTTTKTTTPTKKSL